MGWFDDHIDVDPAQFMAGGGLYGRLDSLLPQQGFYQPTPGSPFPSVSGNASSSPPMSGLSVSPQGSATGSAAPWPVSSLPRDDGQTLNMRIGDYWMPQFGRAETPPPVAAPTFADRLSAGLQSWAHTPLGNPVAALANGVAGFNAGRRSIDQTDRPASVDREGQNGGATLGIAPRRGPIIYPLRRIMNNGR